MWHSSFTEVLWDHLPDSSFAAKAPPEACCRYKEGLWKQTNKLELTSLLTESVKRYRLDRVRYTLSTTISGCAKLRLVQAHHVGQYIFEFVQNVHRETCKKGGIQHCWVSRRQNFAFFDGRTTTEAHYVVLIATYPVASSPGFWFVCLALSPLENETAQNAEEHIS